MFFIKTSLSQLVFLFTVIVSLQAQPAVKGLTLKEAGSETEKVLKAYKEKFTPTAKEDWVSQKILIGTDSLIFTTKIFGSKPADGRSLYISLHGGGNGPAKMNDGQYRNQQKLYTPAEGVYFVPRSPSNTWNMWHQKPVDGLLERAIADAVIMEDVNPNKVYVMGYSAGGDGVYQLAPRLADHWAAAAMMAGHPGDAQVLNLRNLPFWMAVGEKDGAYNRNGLAKEWSKTLDSLQVTDKGGFVHDAYIMAGMPHWMNRQDTISVPWMAKFKRNPYPAKVNWIQDDEVRTEFYWLAVPESSAKKQNSVFVSYKGQQISIDKNDNETLHILLNDKMMNLDKEITVSQNGKVIFKGKAVRRKELIEKSFSQRHDENFVFPAGITITGGKASAM
ncbi:alpha/beta hydrolase [Dyadobacter psychrotolerans]|uniref:Alpha/beta hydrolase n=1 Tax=Dyadobacter psychrotolerans TaxID=2541721 RepID=A0A4R5DMH6_9BACT|nr:alpha/beta hydrolase [Dyadobacter psychrotolerans]TDE14707.1 alpha/beta hydrolase [Dyadobacter psychrotolerans]